MNNNNMEKVKRALLSMQRHSWEQGVAMQAFLELGDMETVAALAFESVNRSMEDGRLATIGVTDGVTDPCSVGEALIRVCEETEDSFLCEGRDRLLEWTLKKAPRNADGIIYHLTRTKEFWVDSMYMLPPYLAAAGAYEEAVRQWNGYWKALFDQDAGLMSHMWNDETCTYTRSAHWGSGNGWALASAARMADLLERAGYMEERAEIVDRARLLLAGVLKTLRSDGLFHDVLDDVTSFVETNLSQMTAYTIYRGITSGWLESSYREYADRMRQAAEAKVNAFGFVADACGAPTFDKPGYSPEAQAFYLMMEKAAEEFAARSV